MMRSSTPRSTVLALLLAVGGCRDDEPDDEVAASASASASKAAPRSDERLGPSSSDATPESPPVRKDGTIFGDSELMGTRVSINVFLDEGKSAVEAKAAMQAALHEMARIEEIMSEWRPHSELSGLSASAGEAPVKISPELFEVLKISKQVSEATGGAFDVTFHGVGQLWSFEPGAEPPAPEAVAAKLPLVDYTALQLDEEASTARLQKPGMMLGLGAIAKGYAVDRASKVLRDRGFPNHVVEGGGDTYAAGTKGGKPWLVGVQNPDGTGTVGVIAVSDEAVVTSGGYQRFFEHDGKRYAHILDPKTGWPIPAERSPKSVTVLADNATLGDAYCTAVTVMGADKGMKFVESRPRSEGTLEAVIIDRDGTVLVSDGLKDRYLTDDAAARAP